MKEIWTWIRELFNSEPEKQNKIQNNEFKNKGDVNITQENNSQTVNNNFVVHADNQVSILDETTVLRKNRELFMFILICFTPLQILSLLQLKLHFFLGSWITIILLLSIILGLRLRKKLAQKFEFLERKWIKNLKNIEEFVQVNIPTQSKQGFLIALLLFCDAVITFSMFFY